MIKRIASFNPSLDDLPIAEAVYRPRLDVVGLSIGRRTHPLVAGVLSRCAIPRHDLVAFLDQLENLNISIRHSLIHRGVRGLRAGEAWWATRVDRVRLEIRCEVLIEIVETILVPRVLDLSYCVLVRASHDATSFVHRERTPPFHVMTRHARTRERAWARI